MAATYAVRIFDASPDLGLNTACVLARHILSPYVSHMRDEAEIRRAVQAKLDNGDTNQECVAKILGWGAQPRVSEWLRGKRKNGIRYDEALKLIERLELGEPPEDPMLPSARFLKAIVRHIALRVGQPLGRDNPLVASLSRTLQALLATSYAPEAANDIERIERQLEEEESAATQRHDTAAA